MMKKVQLPEIFDFIDCRGKSPNKHDSGIPLITAKNVKNGFISEEPREYLNESDYDEWIKRGIPKEGDILFTTEAPLGNIATLPKYDKVVVAQRVICLTPKISIDTIYYKWFMLGDWFQGELIKRSTGSTAKGIRSKELAKIEIPLPPLSEQKRIAAILDAADDYRQKTKALIDKYDELTQSLFLEMFGDPVVNPRGWEVRKFNSIGTLDRGISKHRPRNAPELLGGIHPLIQTGDVANSDRYVRSYNSTYSELGLKQSKKWPIGTLCITIAANIAKTGILTFEACFPDSVVGFIPSEKSRTEYIQYWLSFLQKTLEDQAPESAQKNINLKILRGLDIPTPPINLQNQFVERVQAIEKQKTKAQQSLEKAEELFQSLLQRAFRGELV